MLRRVVRSFAACAVPVNATSRQDYPACSVGRVAAPTHEWPLHTLRMPAASVAGAFAPTHVLHAPSRRRDPAATAAPTAPEGAVALFDASKAFVEALLGESTPGKKISKKRIAEAKKKHLSEDTLNPSFWSDESTKAVDRESRALRLMLSLGVSLKVAEANCKSLAEHLCEAAMSRLCFVDAANVACGPFKVIVDPNHMAKVAGTFKHRHIRVASFNDTLPTDIQKTLCTSIPADDDRGPGRSTVVLRGESGSGKTFNAIAAASAMNGTCVYVLPDTFDEDLLNAINGFAAEAEAQGRKPTDEQRAAMQRALDQRPDGGQAYNAKAMRDELTKQLVLRCVEAAVPAKYRGKPSATMDKARCVVLLFDEMGDQADVVRALCSVCFEDRGLRGEVARLLQLEASDVSVIITGTGVEAHQHLQPGSHGETYHLLLAAPRAWDVLKLSVAPSIRKVLDEGATPALVDARGMLEGNARLAALFAGLAGTAMMADVPHAHIAACLQLAVVRFRDMNGLSNLVAGRDVACELVNALCAQTLAEFSPVSATAPHQEGGMPTDVYDKRDWQRLCVTLGLVVDHARRIRNDKDLKKLPGFEQLASNPEVAVPRGTVRFVAGSAVSSMAHALLFGAGVLGTGEGFEVLAAEFVAFAALFSSAALDFDASRVLRMMPEDTLAWTPPTGWSPPVALVATLQGRGGDGGGGAGSASAAQPAARARREPVWMAQCGQQLLTSNTTVAKVPDTMKKVLSAAHVTTANCSDGLSADAFTALKAQKEAVVLVNGASSPYADVVASVACGGGSAGRRLLLCQCKFYPGKKLMAHHVFKELRKMGHPELATLWAALEHIDSLATPAHTALLGAIGDGGFARIDAAPPKKAVPYDKEAHFADLVGRTRAERAAWLEQLKKSASPALTAADLEAAVDAGNVGAVLTKALAQHAGATPLFVVMVYGLKPDDITSATLPADVELLWAPLVTSAADTTETTAREHAVQRLRGFYPVPFPQSKPCVGVAFSVPQKSAWPTNQRTPADST